MDQETRRATVQAIRERTTNIAKNLQHCAESAPMLCEEHLLQLHEATQSIEVASREVKGATDQGLAEAGIRVA